MKRGYRPVDSARFLWDRTRVLRPLIRHHEIDAAPAPGKSPASPRPGLLHYIRGTGLRMACSINTRTNTTDLASLIEPFDALHLR